MLYFLFNLPCYFHSVDVDYLFSILKANAWKPLESYNYNKEEINQVNVISDGF